MADARLRRPGRQGDRRHVGHSGLHRGGRRFGRMRAGQPAERGRRACRLPAGGRSARPLSVDTHPHRLRQDHVPGSELGLLHRSRSQHAGPPHLLAARPHAGRLQRHQWPDLYPGPARRLRCLGRRRQSRLALGRLPALLPPAGGQRPGREPDARRGRPAERHLDQDAASAGRGHDRGRRRPGVPRVRDFNTGEQEGAGYYQLTTRHGRRCSTAVAYLRPAEGRPNLRVQTGAHAMAVLFEAAAPAACATASTARCARCEPARGAAVRRRAAIAAAAAAVRGRAGGAAAPARHRRGARPAGRGREPAGPSADPADLRDPPSHHHQRPAAHAGRARAHRPAMAAVPRRAAGGRHQPGRPVLPRGSGQRHAGHAVPFRHAVGRHGRRQGASVLGLHLLGVPVAAQLARPCAAAQRRSLRGPVHAAELPVHRAGPPHGGGCGQIRAGWRPPSRWPG